ncbi:MAG: SulP family inorganic anion transporter [Candidatus Obscuribacterales bacterium]|nr:SulP family inorganic anion transporter [Candidatus Obscuribacterales bacterium]
MFSFDGIKSRASDYRENFPKDFLASIVVFLIALPLCMGVAIASGVPPAAGLITGIVGGFIVGTIAGCPLQVSGPAAGLTVLVWEIVQEHGFEMLGVIVLLAGLIQLVAGLLKLGQWFRAVSPAVINGMLSGIGVLIFASQFHVMLDDKPKGSGILNLLSIPQALFDCVNYISTDNSHIAGAIGLLTIFLLIVWGKVTSKKLNLIPAALVAVVVATVVTMVLKLEINTVAVPDSLLAAIQFPKVEAFGRMFELKIFLEALGLAIIASAETLLTATAVDKMHRGQRTRYDRELTGQGIGNVICGVLGALPLTGVIVRSSANVQAGAVTRGSTIMHGAWLFLFVACLPFVLRLIPTACLAAFLVYTGYKLFNFKVIKTLQPCGKSEVAIYLITLLTIVSTDLLTGVAVGMALTTAKLLYLFSHLDILMKTPNPNQTVIYLRGAATFLSLPKLANTLEMVPVNTELHVHFEDLDYIDHACLDLLMDWDVQHRAQGGSLVIDWGTLGAMFRERRSSRRRDSKNVEKQVDSVLL